MSSAATRSYPRMMCGINSLGLGTLIDKETQRFLKIYAQSILAPVLTTLLFFIIFAFALGGNQRSIGSIPYLQFLAPGLVMMSIAQNAFASPSYSIVISKVQGNIVDVLMAPLSALELTIGYMMGGIIRGLVVGLVTVITLAFFTDMIPSNFYYILYHAFMGSTMLALIGLIGGICSEKFDHIASVQNFIVMPATFLSGTFYSADKLPQGWRFLCHLNPFYYMIDGFRYGFIGVSDGTLHIGIGVMAISDMILFAVAYQLLNCGYKLKA